MCIHVQKAVFQKPIYELGIGNAILLLGMALMAFWKISLPLIQHYSCSQFKLLACCNVRCHPLFRFMAYFKTD